MGKLNSGLWHGVTIYLFFGEGFSFPPVDVLHVHRCMQMWRIYLRWVRPAEFSLSPEFRVIEKKKIWSLNPDQLCWIKTAFHLRVEFGLNMWGIACLCGIPAPFPLLTDVLSLTPRCSSSHAPALPTVFPGCVQFEGLHIFTTEDFSEPTAWIESLLGLFVWLLSWGTNPTIGVHVFRSLGEPSPDLSPPPTPSSDSALTSESQQRVDQMEPCFLHVEYTVSLKRPECRNGTVSPGPCLKYAINKVLY